MLSNNFFAGQVDFRYEPTCLMLFLDGHAESIAPFSSIEELEGFAAKPTRPPTRTTGIGPGDLDPSPVEDIDFFEMLPTSPDLVQ